jgi:hypothetical protein
MNSSLLRDILQLFLFLLIPSFVKSRFSYFSDGDWIQGDSTTCDHFMCTPSKNMTWKSTNPQWKYYFAKDACDALVNKGVKKIYFHGDSYMRQIYSSMLITLSGDYRYGSISDAALFPRCEYHRQFSEKHCGLKELKYNGLTCDGRITLEPTLNGFNDLNHCQEGTALLWSFGNHKLSRYGRYGVNNATAHQLSFENVCHSIKQSKLVTGQSQKCSVWWVSTHARIRTIFDDESPEFVTSFNEGMKEFFEHKKCGETNFIDVYNMTNSLVNTVLNKRQDLDEGIKISYDLVHWGMEINLIKAQIIINSLLLNP